jgi:hypothetical protein
MGTSGLEQNTIRIECREGLWQMRVYPDLMQLFRSRELAEACARELACSKIPAWTVVVSEADTTCGDARS